MVTKKRNKLRKGNFVATFGVNKKLHLLAISCKRSFRNLDFNFRHGESIFFFDFFRQPTHFYSQPKMSSFKQSSSPFTKPCF